VAPYRLSLIAAVGLLLSAFVTPANAQTIRVQAENYVNAYDTTAGNSAPSPTNCTYNGLNVDVSNTTDTGGGCNLGWSANGEWVEYTVTAAQAGAYRVNYRYASANANGVASGQLVIKVNGVTQSTTSFTGTGSWNTYRNIYALATLVAGVQTVRIEYVSPAIDLNWFELEYKTVDIADSEVRIEIEDYLKAYDTTAGNSATTPTGCTYYGSNVDIGDTIDGGGCSIGYTVNNEWVEFSINPSSAGTYTFTYRYSSGTTGDVGDILLKVNGVSVATTDLTAGTGNWNKFASVQKEVTLAAGIQTLTIVWLSPSFNINWFSVTPGAAVDPDQLIANWQIEESSWTGGSDEIVDSSGNGFHATLTNPGSPAIETSDPAIDGDPGTCNYANFPDGTGYATIADSGDGSPWDAPEYTVTAWINPTSFPASDWRTIVSHGNHFKLHISSAGLVVGDWLYGADWNRVYSSGAIALNEWTHVAFSYAFGNQKLYLNGVLVSTTSYTEGYVFSNSNITIGHDNGTADRGFRGSIDEVSFYNYPLTGAEVLALASATHSCPAAPAMVGEWRFDEGSWNGTASEVVDNSGNGLHGTTVNVGSQPTTANASPALTGDPGTCDYGNFPSGSGYVSIPDPGTGSILDASNFTIAAWIYPTSYSASDVHSIVTKGGAPFELHLHSSGKIQIDWNYGGGWNRLDSINIAPLNQWTHIAYSFTNGDQKIYLNGALDASASFSNGQIYSNDSIYIGYDKSPTTRAFKGRIDEVRFYDAKLSASQIAVLTTETHECFFGPASIDISASNSASTCVPEPVTVTIKDSGGNIITDYTGTLTLSTSSGNGDWSKTGTASDAYGTLTPGSADSGSATYTFSASDNGSIVLQLSNSRTESLTVSALESEASATGTSSAISYTTNNFTLTDITGGTRIVGYPQVWQVTMMSQDPVTGNCAANTEYTQSGVKAWLIRGAADPGGTASSLTDSGGGGTTALPASEPGSNNFNLTFVNGVAQFTVNTTDVIQQTVYIADKTRSFADVDLVANTGEQVYGPFGFYLTIPNNPGATSASGPVFEDAGHSFSVIAKAVAWQVGDDLDNNKVPDGHDGPDNASRANLADNPVILHFGQEVPPETLTLSSNLVLPLGGHDPGLEYLDSGNGDKRIISQFNSGTGIGSTNALFFNEVGIIELKAEITDGDYMGKGASTAYSQSYSNNVGRFSVTKFNYSSGSLTEACSSGLSFSYLGQNFTGQFIINPSSRKHTLLQNYTGDFIKLGTNDLSFYARDINSATELTARLTNNVTNMDWSGTEGTISVSFTVARASSPDGPFTTLKIGTNVLDSDGASIEVVGLDLDADADGTLESVEISETEVRYGRLYLGDSHGPETQQLQIPLSIEYWDAPSWLTNSDDSCTTIERSAIFYPSGNISTPANRTISLGSGSTTGGYGTIIGDAVGFVEGEADHFFSAPGAGNTGSIATSIDLTSYPWLRFDWNGDGDYLDTETPDNQINFGIYRGHDRMIFWREY
jgi:MSHA biogenesis protein MshQ